MPIEVEIKFLLPDPGRLRQDLIALGGLPSGKQTEFDLYFQHPSRSFVQTDEALRVRRTGSRVHLTYKGPKLDSRTKTRKELEIELTVGDQGASQVIELLECLGFRSVREVRKERELIEVTWQSCLVHVTLDQVFGLG